ncbi:MAG TPA: M23 family metallopeptidase [Anaeromyxobacteraceae bacterium]|nr:M23 family metallopeptidase [Anaeromyxobacteraceae bacterium]
MRRRRPSATPALAALAAVAAGCAHSSSTMTFAQAGLAEPVLVSEPMEPVGPPRPPAKDPAPHRVASEAPPGPPLDGSLLRFAAEARARRQRIRGENGYPREAAEAWQRLGDEVDRYLGRSLPQTPILELVRALVTLEAELEFDRRRFGEPPEELRQRLGAQRARLGARLAAARGLRRELALRPAPALLRWPIDDVGISSLFGWRLHPLDGFRRMHHGIDLAALPGRVVAAAARGFVVQAGWAAGYGLMVEVRHGGDLTTRYSHLSRVLCAPGDEVEPGQGIGLVGATGKATGPHLHFEVWRGGRPRDPLALLGASTLNGDAGN